MREGKTDHYITMNLRDLTILNSGLQAMNFRFLILSSTLTVFTLLSMLLVQVYRVYSLRTMTHGP